MASVPVKSFRSDGGGGRGGIGGRFDRRSSGAVKAVYGWNGLAAAPRVPPPARLTAAPAEEQPAPPPLIPADALGSSVVVKRGGWRGGAGKLKDSPSLGPTSAVGASPGGGSSSVQSTPWQEDALSSSPPRWPTPPLTGADLLTHHPAASKAAALIHAGHSRTSIGTASLPVSRVRGPWVLTGRLARRVVLQMHVAVILPHASRFLPRTMQATPTFRGDHAVLRDDAGGLVATEGAQARQQLDSAPHAPPPREAIEEETWDASTTAPRQQTQPPAVPMSLQQFGGEPRPQLRSGGPSGGRLLSLERGLLAHTMMATPTPAQLTGSSPTPAAATPEDDAYTPPLESPAGFLDQHQQQPSATPSSQDTAAGRTRPTSSPRSAAAVAAAMTAEGREGLASGDSGGGPGVEPEESKGAGSEGGGGRRSEGCVALSFEGAESA